MWQLLALLWGKSNTRGLSMLPRGAHATVKMHCVDSHWVVSDYLWFSFICYWLSLIHWLFIDCPWFSLILHWLSLTFLDLSLIFIEYLLIVFLHLQRSWEENSSVESFSSAIVSPSEGSHAPETQSAGNQSPESQSPHAGTPSISKTSRRSPIQPHTGAPSISKTLRRSPIQHNTQPNAINHRIPKTAKYIV